MSSEVIQWAVAPFGVQIDAGAVLNPSEAGKAELRRLFDEQGLIVVKGLPPLAMDEQKAICRLFGPVLDTPLENFIISNVRDDGYLGVQELLFHNDLPYLPMPYAGGSLHALDVAEATTSTRFACATRAWDSLPAALRDRVAGLNALHLKQRVFDRPNRLSDMEPGDVCAIHAVAPRHERTGRRYLFVNESMTGGIAGLPEAESDALLAELFAHLYVPGNVYEHRWQVGDLVIWDNLAVQHARGRVSAEPRTLQRVSIAAIGYAQMYPTDLGIMGDQYADTLARGAGAATAR